MMAHRGRGYLGAYLYWRLQMSCIYSSLTGFLMSDPSLPDDGMEGVALHENSSILLATLILKGAHYSAFQLNASWQRFAGC